jgi:predicted Fe-Mo cluster-binding NifX family protein
MKIAIPMNVPDMQSGVCSSLGRAPYFLIYDTDTSESTWLDNAAAASAGGAGIRTAQMLADSGADALITPRCGDNAGKVLRGAGIRVYRSKDGTAERNIDALMAGELEPLVEFHAGHHGHER